MANMKKYTIKKLALAFVPVMALSLGACTQQGPTVDYRQNYPIKVESERVTITVKLPDNGMAMEPMDETRFNRFLRDYVGRGRGRVEVAAPLGEGDVANSRVGLIQDFLSKKGLPSHQVFYTSTGLKESRQMTLTFAANKVVVPECRDWKKGPGYSFKNYADSNFGCSYQRNLGLMVADPGDLVQARPMSGRDMGADHGPVETIPVNPGTAGGSGSSADQ